MIKVFRFQDAGINRRLLETDGVVRRKCLIIKKWIIETCCEFPPGVTFWQRR